MNWGRVARGLFLSAALTAVRLLGQINDTPALLVNSNVFTNALSSALIPHGTSLPATCSVGQLFFLTTATAGQNIHECTATNVWTQQLNTGTGGASNFTAPGTGGVARSIANGIGELGFNVKNYGAQGDNSTDDTVNIQKAIDAAALVGPSSLYRGSVVYFPPGKYRISAPLLLYKSGLNPTNVVQLRGDSPLTSILVGTSGFPAGSGTSVSGEVACKGMIEWPASAARAWNQSIKNLGFALPPVAQTCAIHYPISSAALPTGTVSDEGVLWAQWGQFTFENLYFEESNQYNPYDIYLEGGNHGSYIHNLVSNPSQGAAVNYSTVLLKTDSCDLGIIGEDACGIDFGFGVDGMTVGRGYGGYTKAFEGRLLQTSFKNVNSNPPYSGSAYNFKNTVASNIENISNEGSGSTTGQIRIDHGHGNTFTNIGIGGPGGFTGPISGFYFTSKGSGYTSAPTVTVPGCSGYTITATVGSGQVTGITISAGGTCTEASSSTSAVFSGGGGSGASAQAYIGGGDGLDLIASTDNIFDYRFSANNTYYVSFVEAGFKLINADAASHRNTFKHWHTANTLANEVSFGASDNYIEAYDWKNGTQEVLGTEPISGPILFANLPTCNSNAEGIRRTISNSSTQTWGAAADGAGSLHAGVRCNGSAWTVEAK